MVHFFQYILASVVTSTFFVSGNFVYQKLLKHDTAEVAFQVRTKDMAIFTEKSKSLKEGINKSSHLWKEPKEPAEAKNLTEDYLKLNNQLEITNRMTEEFFASAGLRSRNMRLAYRIHHSLKVIDPLEIITSEIERGDIEKERRVQLQDHFCQTALQIKKIPDSARENFESQMDNLKLKKMIVSSIQDQLRKDPGNKENQETLVKQRALIEAQTLELYDQMLSNPFISRNAPTTSSFIREPEIQPAPSNFPNEGKDPEIPLWVIVFFSALLTKIILGEDSKEIILGEDSKEIILGEDSKEIILGEYSVDHYDQQNKGV